MRRNETEATFPNLVRFSFEFAKTLLTLFAWAAIYFGYRLQQMLKTAQLDRLRLDAAVKESELKALRSQVNPHFLFNSLNTIRALIEEDRLKAREGINRLAELFRASLRSSEVDTVSLRTELQTVNAYVGLEKLRFEDRLQIRMEVDPKAMEMTIPPFVLQTLVENAFKHGVSIGSHARITIDISIGQKKLIFTCENTDHSAVKKLAEEKGGIGLENVRRRLELLYPGRHRLQAGAEGGKYTVNLQIELA